MFIRKLGRVWLRQLRRSHMLSWDFEQADPDEILKIRCWMKVASVG